MSKLSIKPYKSALFLRTLCLLTIIGSLLSAFFTFWFASFDVLFTSFYLLINLLCLIASIMMLKLDKRGFYIYISAQSFQILYSFLFIIDSYALYIPIIQDVIFVLFFILIVFPLLFIVLY